MVLNIGIGINLEMGTTVFILNLKIGKISVKKISKKSWKMQGICRNEDQLVE